MISHDDLAGDANERQLGAAVGSQPDPKAYRRAVCDVILRTTFALAIVAAGCWIPESYLDQISWYWMDPDPVVRLASLVSKLAACVFAVMAFWSFHCMFDAWWIVKNRSKHQTA